MLYFVGVGPGDPELITMKAVRILQEADMIVLPDTGKNSVVWAIIERWWIISPCIVFPYQCMVRNRNGRRHISKRRNRFVNYWKNMKLLRILYWGTRGSIHREAT